MKINKTEQWLLEGKCKKCRRKAYYSKPCTKNKKRFLGAMRNMVKRFPYLPYLSDD